MPRRDELRVRDPFVVAYEDTYYLYVGKADNTVYCYTSNNLEDWQEMAAVFTIPKDSWSYRDVWAPEVHRLNGKFYLFVSLKGRNGLRGTQVAVSDTPVGPFVPVTNRPITPAGHSCIDATLFVDGDVPYIIYSHDWPDNYVKDKDAYIGEIWAAQVDSDLINIVGEPFRLFASDESPISSKTPHHIEYDGKKTIRYGSDAPFMQRMTGGELLLTWSPYLDGNYVVLSVVSQSGNIRGPWKHLPEPLFDKNGGHAMFFKTLEGKQMMCLHQPECPPMERTHFFYVEEREGILGIKSVL